MLCGFSMTGEAGKDLHGPFNDLFFQFRFRHDPSSQAIVPFESLKDISFKIPKKFTSLPPNVVRYLRNVAVAVDLRTNPAGDELSNEPKVSFCRMLIFNIYTKIFNILVNPSLRRWPRIGSPARLCHRLPLPGSDIAATGAAAAGPAGHGRAATGYSVQYAAGRARLDRSARYDGRAAGYDG